MTFTEEDITYSIACWISDLGLNADQSYILSREIVQHVIAAKDANLPTAVEVLYRIANDWTDQG